MPMYLMPSARPPFSDWCAQVERVIERRTGRRCDLPNRRALIPAYNYGLTPQEIAADLIN